MSVRSSYLWLSMRSGIGPVTQNELLRVFGSPDKVYAAEKDEFKAAYPQLREVQLNSLCDKRLDVAERIIEECRKKDIRIITIGDTEYPSLLSHIPDPPIVIYARGRWPDFSLNPGIAVVGTRKATAYGQKASYSIGANLAKAGFVTVSGMALGVDGAAHRGALKYGGLTVAVLSGGADVCYPREHKGLMGDIMLSGAVLSEYPPGTEPARNHYHQRNRIISGLCIASVIVEAKDYRSGSLITARHAVDQGRDVYAVPGSWGSPVSEGCNKLIADSQATLLTSPSALIRVYSDIAPKRPTASSSYYHGGAENEAPKPVKKRGPEKAFENTEPKPQPVPVVPENKPEPPEKEVRKENQDMKLKAAQEKKKAEKPWKNAVGSMDKLSEDEKKIIKFVGEGVTALDDIIDHCGLTAPRVISLVTMLEVNGILRREHGELALNKIMKS